ncbi:hypothetical protein H5410_026362 [Solanum commersonii]|uniref:Uncharacterized protein n=1 Tax=Solanum commersonii TaxID=4109 RepID=A0A9J5Z1A9_SOLCO|nr:hypothetical protein H5410_026362 [Solanum commersonii]
MAKTRGGIIKRSDPNTSKNKKRKAEKVSKVSKKKKSVVEEHESNSDSATMTEIDNYQDSGAQSSDDVESSNDKSESEYESSRDTHTGDEDEDPLSLPICAKDFFDKSNASYALYGFPWAFLVWIYEVFSHLGKYAKKSLDSPLPIPRLLRWHTAKNDNIIEGDPFKSKGKSTKVVHPYLTLIVRETKKNYLTTLYPYVDEVKDTVLDALKANSKGETIFTSSIENVKDEYLTTDLAVDDDNFSAPTVNDEILPLAIVNDDLVADDAYFAEENDEEKEEEKLEEKKEEESEEENLEEKKNEENEASGEEEKEQQEEKITENEEKEKLEEEGLATDMAEVEKEIDVMNILMELNGEIGGDE